MPEDRLPWFPCEPSKLLGALSAMKPHVGYTYWIVCLRCYEVGGACPDSLDALARRTGHSKRVVSDALDVLFKAGKLVRDAAGIHNPYAAKIIDEMRLRREGLSAAGREGANRKWGKRKWNQRKDDGHPIDSPMAKNAHLHLQEESLGFRDKPESPERGGRAGARTTLAADWQPTIGDLDYAKQHGFDQGKAQQIAGAFADHHHAKGNRMADWSAAWRTWIRNEVKFNTRRGSSNDERDRSATAAAQRLVEGLRNGSLSIPLEPRSPSLLFGKSEATPRLLPQERRK